MYPSGGRLVTSVAVKKINQSINRIRVKMVTLDFKTLIAPEGILRILEVIFLCVILRLVLSVSHQTNSFWIYCMFTWCFCVCVTILILVLEFLSLSSKLPISWDDFTTAFAMVATLMVCTDYND